MIQDTKTWSLENDRFTISTGQGFETFFFKDLIMCKGADNRTELYLLGRKTPLTVSQTLKVWEEGLSKEIFWRVHKSYIINRGHIVGYSHMNRGVMVLTQDCIAYVSDDYHDMIIAALKANMIYKEKA